MDKFSPDWSEKIQKNRVTYKGPMARTNVQGRPLDEALEWNEGIWSRGTIKVIDMNQHATFSDQIKSGHEKESSGSPKVKGAFSWKEHLYIMEKFRQALEW